MAELNTSDAPKRQQHNTNRIPSTKSMLGLTFGLFMMCIYVGMGILLMYNFFGWTESWTIARWVVGVVLIIYGIFRGWRQYKDFTQTDE